MDPLNLRSSQLVSLTFSVFLFLCFSRQAAADLSSDREALLSFSAAVRHGRKLNWTLDTPTCSAWIGVKCTKNGARVVGVRLPGIGLIGDIPSNSLGKLEALQVLSLRSNKLTGKLPPDISSLPSLRFLYLQHNNFSGNLPDSFSPTLNSLDLSFNLFSGEIPGAIRNLSQLASLNLENNILSGPIPDLKLLKLRHLNLSFNNLNGSVPFSLQTFPNDSFTGNLHLCGPPLPHCSAVLPSPSPSFPSSPVPLIPNDHPKNSNKKLTIGVIIAMIVGGLAFLFLFLLAIFIMKRNYRESNELTEKKVSSIGRGGQKREEYSSGVQEAETKKLIFFDSCSYYFDMDDLLRASAGLLGKGSYGTSFWADLEDGTRVVVKRLKALAVGKKEFEQQMEVIVRVGSHANILPLRAYYYAKQDKFLVYEYAACGNLSALLHGNKYAGTIPLNWESRLKIMLGTAKAIAHLHEEGGAKFAHGNIRSSNILLFLDLHPLLSEHGVSQLINSSTIPSRSPASYLAPEFLSTRKFTHQTDVYSFGVVLLEILTGKYPICAPGDDEIVVDLPRWVQSVVREEWTAEVFDLELMRCPNSEEELVGMLQIALACTSKDPHQRPTMQQVVRMIEDLRPTVSGDRLSSDDDYGAFGDVMV